MTPSARADDQGGSSASPGSAQSAPAALRIAVLDRDSGFIQVLCKRMDRLGWEHRVLEGPVPREAVVSMRLSALVVDLAVLGPQAWAWLERLCEALPELGIVVCTAPSTVAQRVRGLRLGADDWVTKPPSRGGDRARAERRAPPPAQRRARADSPRAGRRGRDPLGSLPGLRGHGEHRPHAP